MWVTPRPFRAILRDPRAGHAPSGLRNPALLGPAARRAVVAPLRAAALPVVAVGRPTVPDRPTAADLPGVLVGVSSRPHCRSSHVAAS